MKHRATHEKPSSSKGRVNIGNGLSAPRMLALLSTCVGVSFFYSFLGGGGQNATFLAQLMPWAP